MEFKTEPYEEHPGDLFDIPAAEQEITVGSNEQTLLSSALVSPGGIMASTPSSVPLVINSPGITIENSQSGSRPPRVIMLQRTGPASTLGVTGSGVRPGIKVSFACALRFQANFYFSNAPPNVGEGRLLCKQCDSHGIFKLETEGNGFYGVGFH